MATVVQELNTELARVIGEVGRSLVQVSSGSHGAGAGTIWHPEGLVLTNAHVIGHGPLRVTAPGGPALPARVLAHDAGLDLAALVVEASGLPTIALGDSRKLRPGELVFALGHPWGVLGATTAGVVIGLETQGPELPGSAREWIVASLHLRPGNSGGPLVDAQGRLMGINTVMASPKVGMAVPVHVVKAFLRREVGAETAPFEAGAQPDPRGEGRALG